MEQLKCCYGAVAAVVKLRHLRALGEPYAEGLVDGAPVFLISGEAARGADTEDFVHLLTMGWQV